MAKIKNDPATYRKRSDIAKGVAAGAEKRAPRPLTMEQRALVMAAFKKSRPGKAAFVPLGRLFAK